MFCPLWNHGKVTEIQLIEGDQRTFTSRVSGLKKAELLGKALQTETNVTTAQTGEVYHPDVENTPQMIYHSVLPNSCDIQFKRTSRHCALAVIPLLSRTS